MSLGGRFACPETIQNAINAATTAGAVVVVAAGNSNENVNNFAPANCSGVIAVAATNRSGIRASYSNFGTGVHVAAPGGQGSTASNAILSTLNDGTTTYNDAPAGFNYVAYQGTSMAAPHVSAAVALLKDNIPSVTTNQARAVLQATATSFPGGAGACTTTTCGAGLLDAARVAAVNTSTPSASSDLVNFSQVPPGTTSTPQIITITNSGTSPAEFGGLPVITPEANFSLVSNTCSGSTIAPGGTCSVGISFVAPVTGIVRASLGLPVTITVT